MDYLFSFKSKEPQKGFSFLPKRKVDLKSCEILRGVRATPNIIEYVTFKVPRKSGTFQADLYPACKSAQAAQTFQEWWDGSDKDPVRMDLRPETTNQEHVVNQQRKQTFMNKLQGKADSSFQGYQEESKQDNSQEIQELNQKIANLNNELQEAHDQISDWRNKCAQLEQENDDLKN